MLERAGGARRAARKAGDKPVLVASGGGATKKPGRSHIPLRKQIDALEEKMGKFQALIGRIDQALANPDTFQRDKGRAATLAQQRKELAKALTLAEEEWLMLTSESEAAQ